VQRWVSEQTRRSLGKYSALDAPKNITQFFQGNSRLFSDRKKVQPGRCALFEVEEHKRWVDKLQQYNIVFAAAIDHRWGPDTALNFTDVCLSKIKHTQSRLSDAATDG